MLATHACRAEKAVQTLGVAVTCAIALLMYWATLCEAQEASTSRSAENAIGGDSEDGDPGPLLGTLQRPKEGVQHPDLDNAWSDYATAIDKATESIKSALAKQFDAATKKGDLEGAEKWQAAINSFEEDGRLPGERGMRTFVAPGVVACKKAGDELHRAYEAVIKALTMEKNISSAKATRDERDRLLEDMSRHSDLSPRTNTRKVATPPRFRNSIGVELRLVPAGVFRMGAADGEEDEKPAHDVRLTKPFYLGVTEVTNAQWKRVMGSVPSEWKEDDLPVENVSWEDAVEFCRKLSELPQEKAARRIYRLPFEAEWEYSCRAGTTTKYSFGDNAAFLSEHGWFEGNSGGKAHPVAQKQPNARGFYDMHGNVYEACYDWFGPHPSQLATDPQGPPAGTLRVHRGGSCRDNTWFCRTANRDSFGPSSRDRHLGFRVALSTAVLRSPRADE